MCALFVAPDGWNKIGYGGLPRFSARRKNFWDEAWRIFSDKFIHGPCTAAWNEEAQEALEAMHLRSPLSAVVCSKAFGFNEEKLELSVSKWCAMKGIVFQAIENHDVFSSA